MMLDVDPGLLGDTEERAELRAVLRGFLEKFSAPADVHRHLESGRPHDPALWARMATEIGVPGLVIPPEHGGSGAGFADLAVAVEEAGRALLCAPLLSTAVLATYTLLLGGDAEARARYLPGIAAGALTATVAGFDAESGGALRAEPSPGGWVGNGSADFVIDGCGADVILLAAGTPAGPAVFACDAGAPGLTRTSRTVLDQTRPQALITLSRTPITPVGPPGADGVVARVLDIGRAALACEQVGGSAFVLAATVDYVRQRHQFGRPVGSFQAVKHRLADLLIELEAAKSAAAYAVSCVAGSSPDLPVAASAAKVVCSAAYRRATDEYLQLSGGIGFTWEHPAHRYVRRARSAEVLFGTVDDHLARLAALI
jgi:alkylation response protein AidB-like acyl-CoA dehydrogenase